jgi:hypothetical protein
MYRERRPKTLQPAVPYQDVILAGCRGGAARGGRYVDRRVALAQRRQAC